MSIETAQTPLPIYLNVDGCLDERPEGTKFDAKYDEELASPWTTTTNPDAN